MRSDVTTTDPAVSISPAPDQDARIVFPALDQGARIARLFEMTSDLLASISLDGRFTLLNPAWEQVLG
jgi:PAS domain-containing protein